MSDSLGQNFNFGSVYLSQVEYLLWARLLGNQAFPRKNSAHHVQNRIYISQIESEKIFPLSKNHNSTHDVLR